MTRRHLISHFSPQRSDPADLEKILVQRHDLLAASVDKIRESILTGNKHHLLLIGPRGAGKTHLITLVHHRLSQQTDLTDKFRFAWLNEDETSTSFLKLLIRIYRDLSQRYPSEFPEQELKAVFGKDANTARDLLERSFLTHLQDRTAVVLIENLDALFSVMPEGEQRTWRAFVQNHPVFATVGTAQSLFDGVSDRDEPFFGFFDSTHLQTLSVEEAAALLVKLAEMNEDRELVEFLGTTQGKARLRAIHHLAGGNPRLYIIFSDFLTKESLDDLVRPFKETVDKQLTAYYQERLRCLSAQQQEIVQFLCRVNHPVPVKDIAEGIFASHNTTTGQLKQLREKGYVYVSTHVRGREVLYELAEPLMRLSFQVKESNDRKPLTLIVEFLQVWYDRKELEELVERLDPGSVGRLYYEAALQKQISERGNLLHKLLRQGLDNIDLQSCGDDALERLQYLADVEDEPANWNRLASIHAFRENGDAALAYWAKTIVRPDASQALLADALLGSAVILSRRGLLQEAFHYCTTVLGLKNLRMDLFGMAHIYRGQIHLKAGMFEEAFAEYDEVIRNSKVPVNWRVSALYSRGCAAANGLLLNDAIESFTAAIEMLDAPGDLVCKAMAFRGIMYWQVHQFDLAMQDFTDVIDYGQLIPEALQALVNRAMLQLHLKHPVEATNDFEKVLTHREKSALPDVPGFHPAIFCSELVKSLFQWALLEREWKSGLSRMVGGVADLHISVQLGEALVSSIKLIRRFNEEVGFCQDWVEAWSHAGAGIPEFEIPLRLLRTGVEWIRTKVDTTLLSLAKEERRVVREALGLSPEAEAR